MGGLLRKPLLLRDLNLTFDLSDYSLVIVINMLSAVRSMYVGGGTLLCRAGSGLEDRGGFEAGIVLYLS